MKGTKTTKNIWLSELRDKLRLCQIDRCKTDIVWDCQYKKIVAYHNGECRSWDKSGGASGFYRPDVVDDLVQRVMPDIILWMRQRHHAHDPEKSDWNIHRVRRVREKHAHDDFIPIARVRRIT